MVSLREDLVSYSIFSAGGKSGIEPLMGRSGGAVASLRDAVLQPLPAIPILPLLCMLPRAGIVVSDAAGLSRIRAASCTREPKGGADP